MSNEKTPAADQPTTVPSAVERAAEVLDRAWSDHHAACVAWSEDTDPATLGDYPRLLTNLDLAQALADAGLLAAAAQPAADKCDGSGRCTAHLHVHGCFADLEGHCDDPDDHPAADTER